MSQNIFDVLDLQSQPQSKQPPDEDIGSQSLTKGGSQYQSGQSQSPNNSSGVCGSMKSAFPTLKKIVRILLQNGGELKKEILKIFESFLMKRKAQDLIYFICFCLCYNKKNKDFLDDMKVGIREQANKIFDQKKRNWIYYFLEIVQDEKQYLALRNNSVRSLIGEMQDGLVSKVWRLVHRERKKKEKIRERKRKMIQKMPSIKTRRSQKMNEQEREEKMMRMIQASEKKTEQVNRYERFDSIDPQDIMQEAAVTIQKLYRKYGQQ